MKFWKQRGRKSRRHSKADTSSLFVVSHLTPEELHDLPGDRTQHIEARRSQLKAIQSRMQSIKIALLADVSLWLLDEHQATLQNLVTRNLEYAQAMGVHLSEFKAEAEAFEATFLPQTQEWFYDMQFWWHHDASSVLYARSHYGNLEATLYTVREVLDAPFRHLVDAIAQRHCALIRKYCFPLPPHREFVPILSRAPESIAALLNEYDALLEPGRQLVAQIESLEAIERLEQSQTLWKNA